MTNHYYNSNLETKSNIQKFNFKLLTKELTFFTDHGVFSKNTVDYGTQVLVKNFKLMDYYRDMLDLGCGYGPVGISLAKEFSTVKIDMVDVNLRAIELAKRNAASNNVDNVEIFKSDLYENITKKYDCILTNPPIRAGKKVVHEIFSKSIEYLNDDGEIYVVIQKKQGAPSAKDKLQDVFGNCDIICKDKGYYILKSKKIK